MRYIFLIFFFSTFNLIIKAQYYELPVWVEDLPYSNYDIIYSIGISDPRMKDTALAEKIAINRALCLAVIAGEADVLLTSDLFEKKSEEYRWTIMKDVVEELAKISAKAYVDESLYSIINKHTNANGETLVLLKLNYTKSKTPNFFVAAEYYRKEFEVSNTRAMESVKNIILKSSWKTEKMKDSLKSIYDLTIWNSDITAQIFFDGTEINTPGYSYEYKPSIPDGFDIKMYTANSSAKKGLWMAYTESLMNSFVLLAKNYESKFKTVKDDYKVSRNDGIYEVSNESLSRSVTRNSLKFEYGGFGIYNNRLFSRTYLKDYRQTYVSYNIKQQMTEDSIKNSVKKKCFLKRIFSKKICS